MKVETKLKIQKVIVLLIGLIGVAIITWNSNIWVSTGTMMFVFSVALVDRIDCVLKKIKDLKDKQ